MASIPPRSYRLLMFQLAAASLGLLMLLRMAVALPRGSRLTNESGIWTALAIDYAHGVLYRPIVGPLGIGGTRYFPLHVLIQGQLIRHGMSPLTAGYVIVVISALGLLAGLYTLLRQLGVRAGLAWPIVLLATGSGAADIAFTTIRGDLLPTCLNVAGLACTAAVYRAVDRRSFTWAIAAGALFALAFFAKVTALFGISAAVLALIISERRQFKPAIAKLLTFTIVSAIALAIVEHASGGQFWINFRACASGGRGLLYILERIPFLLSQAAVDANPVECGLFVATGAVLLVSSRSTWLGLAGCSLFFTAAATALMFGSPGVWLNHLIDVEIALLVFAAVATTQSAEVERLAVTTFSVLAIAASAHAALRLQGDSISRVDAYTAMVKKAAASSPPGTPILTDFMLLSELRGQSPYILDDFELALLGRDKPAVRDEMYRRLDHREFAAVIAKGDPAGDLRKPVWGEPFMPHLLANYHLSFEQDGFSVYTPR